MKIFLASVTLSLSFAAILNVAIAETPIPETPIEKSLDTETVSSAESSQRTTASSPEVASTVNPQIDYRKFIELTAENETVRQSHRVKVEKFASMAAESGTIILDTRSKSAFDEVRVRGAVHLNFSDFTDAKLAEIIPDKTTRILIYCNNNFLPNKLRSMMLKRPALALNIPTFVNLRGYGYKNVFELADVVALDNPHLKLVGTAMSSKN